MFGIGFFELIVLGVVSLVVLGPERLPGAIRTLSLWIGRLRRNFNSIKADIEKEIGADEIRRQLRNEEIMEKFRNTQSKVQNSIQSIKKDADTFRKNVELEADAAAGKIAGQDAGQNESPADSNTAEPAIAAPAAESPRPAATPDPASEAPAPAPESTEPKSGS